MENRLRERPRTRTTEVRPRCDYGAVVGLTHDHGPPAVQVDADVLVSVVLAHLGSFAVT
ncbi:hypothetical protein [Streptomyces camelliae]|uniref:Uncharacterized protein n=1 Tax=Streptomyces camelliae TaxID=3004093 RepID=A0ABY7PIY6_9ACTN|nr:hypothetical protein [Streptomyces sp. HUAS 2-6]WBO69508.1 hypothetical protein O1G22_00225 [Streptomyces sp. HUAS 2-6]